MKGTIPTWVKNLGVRLVIEPRRCLLKSAAAGTIDSAMATNGYAEQTTIYALSSESTVWTPKCDLARG